MKPIDLRPGDLEAVRRILAEQAPGREIRAFGSRVSWTAKEFSDLDLVVMGEPPPSLSDMERLSGVFTESDLPFKVDLVVWATTQDYFRRIIEKNWVVIQEGGKKQSHRAGEWQTHRIGDLGRVVTGKTPSTAIPENFGGGYPFITIPDLDGQRDISSAARTLSELGAQSLRTCQLPAGSVMMSCIATIGRSGITTQPSFTNQQINSLICGPEVNPTYVYYCFTQLGQALEAAGGGGSVYTNVSKSRFEDIKLALPPLAEQKRIAQILGTLDDKIELNRRMNATLEAMARALFQSWFVDFDPVRTKADGRKPDSLDPATAALFPDSFQDSELGHIPSGWTVETLDAIASVSSGKRPVGRNDIQSAECNIPLYGGGGRMGYVPSPLYEKPILFTGRVGTLGLIFRTAEPSWPSDNTLIVEPKDGIFDFTYFVLKGFDLITLNRGSTQPLLTQTDLKSQRFVLPPPAIVEAYAMFAAPIFDQITRISAQSRTLAALRDTLLPRLLSGEVSLGQERIS